MEKPVVIFDTNGTIIDSEFAQAEAYREVLEKYGIHDFTIEEFSEEFTKKGNDLRFILKKRGRDDLLPNVGKIKAEKNKIFLANLKRLEIMPQVKETLQRIKKDVVLVLDSTTFRRGIDSMLQIFELSDLFKMITSGDMEWDEKKWGKMSKSARFKHIADKLRINPSQCVVVGDAEKDIRAAHGAGMKVISVPNQYTKENDFSNAERVLDSFEDLTVGIIKEVVV